MLNIVKLNIISILVSSINFTKIFFIKTCNTQFAYISTDHKYSTAELVPDTFSYTGNSDVLDLTRYFAYMTSLIVIVYVSPSICFYFE